MQSIWLDSYQDGVPATIDPDQYASLNALFAESLAKYDDAPVFSNMGQVLTYAQLDSQSRAFAAYLQNVLHLQKGDRFAIMLPNLMQYPVALLGVLRAGCVVVNVNPLYTPPEVVTQLSDAQVSGILVLDNFAYTLQQALAQCPVANVMVTSISDIFAAPKAYLVDFVVKYIKRMVPKWNIAKHIKYKDVLEQGAKLQYTDPQCNAEDLAFLQYTGGTTGTPKGAMLTHRNIMANILQITVWISGTLTPREEIVVTSLPLYHIFSLTVCLTLINYGALSLLITNPRDTKGFIKDLSKHKFSVFVGVNTLFNLLLNQEAFRNLDFSSLKLTIAGGMAVHKSVAKRWQEVTHNPITEGYGLTESSPVVTLNPLTHQEYNGTIGIPFPSTEISVRDDAGNEVAIGELGELWIRGPQVMRGYWQKPKPTKEMLTEDGWLRSGDIVTIDPKGFVRVVDRKKDIVIVSGFNVYPNEIEDAIALIPGVLEVAVVGVQDPEHGELVKAFIVRSDMKLNSEMVIAYCRERLTGYKVPKLIEFRESLPKTNVGKILRRALR